MTLYDILVLSGGGIKGYCYLGVLKHFSHDQLKSFKYIAGTSIGALFGVLLLIGYTYIQLSHIFLNLDLKQLENLKITNLLTLYGLDDASKIRKLLETCFERKSIPIDITFEQLFETTKKQFICNATSLTTFDSNIFSKDTSPLMPVIDAILLSINIPIIFTQKQYKNTMYIDGGLSNNFIINHFVDIQTGQPLNSFTNQRILGIYLDSSYSTMKVSSLFDYLGCILKGLYNKYYDSYKVRIKQICNPDIKLIFIPLLNIQTYNSDLTIEEKKKLHDFGYTVVSDALSCCDGDIS